LVAEVFPSAGFRINVQFKTMTETLEFKHSSISSASNSQNRDEHDQPEIRENDNDTMGVVTSNNRSNEAEKTPKEDVTNNEQAKAICIDTCKCSLLNCRW
jgi:hypothetical protein